MYSTCLFCHSQLGTNEAIEHFPVGRRLAFDAAKGRLWVVCGTCERWNLTPLEERWEAIEECERAFRDTRLRVSTDNVGLARLREGTTLVRIGDPQRPELAAWRYGDQFGRRRTRYMVGFAGASVAVAGLIVAGPIMGLISGSAVNLLNLANVVRNARPIARITVDGEPYRLNVRALAKVKLLADAESGYELEVPYMASGRSKVNVLFLGVGAALSGPQQPTISLRGDDALAAARTLLPRINARGGGAAAVRDAVDLLEKTPVVRDLYSQVAQPGQRRSVLWSNVLPRSQKSDAQYPLITLPAAQRLALEMALHEADERRALEGELAVLEARWKEAEEIAAISDDMFLPPSIVERLRTLKGG